MSYALDFEGNSNNQLKGVEQFERQTGGQGCDLVINNHTGHSIDSVVPVVDDVVDNNRHNYDVDPHGETGLTHK